MKQLDVIDPNKNNDSKSEESKEGGDAEKPTENGKAEEEPNDKRKKKKEKEKTPSDILSFPKEKIIIKRLEQIGKFVTQNKENQEEVTESSPHVPKKEKHENSNNNSKSKSKQSILPFKTELPKLITSPFFAEVPNIITTNSITLKHKHEDDEGEDDSRDFKKMKAINHVDQQEDNDSEKEFMVEPPKVQKPIEKVSISALLSKETLVPTLSKESGPAWITKPPKTIGPLDNFVIKKKQT